MAVPIVRLSWRRRLVAGLVAGGLAGSIALLTAPASRADDTHDDFGAPITNSAVTVSGRGSFAGMSFSVNQTAELANQAISISWSGGTPSVMNGTKFATDFVQVMQCWGDPVPASDAANYVSASSPGPARENCEFGATPHNDANNPTSFAQVASRVTTTAEESYNGLTPKYTSGGTGLAEIPFDTYDGQTASQTDSLVSGVTPNNSFFTDATTNEVDGARTTADGTGHVWFQTDTAYEAPGLGCGFPQSNGKTLVPCWLVIVPRGHVDASGNALSDQNPVASSPLTPAAWANRIAIPLNFAPLEQGCPTDVAAEETNGSQLAGAAMNSWQPKLCTGKRIYSFTSIDDGQARSQLAAGMTPFIFTSQPVDNPNAAKPVTYAPATLSGVTVGFNIDQVGPASAAGRQVMHVNLTPRLMAKLLTFAYRQNYTGAVSPPVVNLTSSVSFASGYEWLAHEPYSLVYDPEFKKYNPDLYSASGAPYINGSRITAASVIVELGNTDVAQVVWQWILADPAAKAWLAGTPDDSGMVVPPSYKLDTAKTTWGSCFPADSAVCFPQNDAWKYYIEALNSDSGETVKSPPITMLDFHPYANDTTTAAQMTFSANDGEKTLFTPGAIVGTGLSAIGAQPVGTRFVLSITDTASAQRFGLQAASLSAAGDDASPNFVAPTSQSLTAAVAQMQPAGSTGLLWPDPTAQNGAYPLSLVTYAATIPANLTKQQCTDYATLLSYAAGSGQIAGDSLGELPRGYVPLPNSLTAQTRSAASTVKACAHPANSTGSTSSRPSSGSTSSTSPGAGSSQTGSGSGGSVAPLPVDGSAAAPVAAPVAPAASAANLAPAAQLVLAAGTTPDDPPSFTSALPIAVIVGVLAGLAAPLLGGIGSGLLNGLRAGRLLDVLRRR